MILPISIDFPENVSNLDGLIEQIALARCCAFVGAGISTGPGYQLLNGVIDHLRAVAIAAGHNIDVSGDEAEQIDAYRKAIGEEQYRVALINLFGPIGKDNFHSIHHTICAIPFISWITTNYDYCLENAASAANKPINVQHYPELNPTLLRDHQIFHIHGLIEPTHLERYAGTIVLSKHDYEKAYEPNKSLHRFLATISEWSTLVFMGYSLRDKELTRIIKTTQLELYDREKHEFEEGLGKRKRRKHYILMHIDANVNLDAVNDLDLIPIYFSGETVRYTGLEEILNIIREKTTNIVYPLPVINRDMFED
jgi:hypothetical protein